METLEDLARDQNEDVRILVAMNINAPLKLLNFLAKDESENVRQAVAWHGNISD